MHPLMYPCTHQTIQLDKSKMIHIAQYALMYTNANSDKMHTYIVGCYYASTNMYSDIIWKINAVYPSFSVCSTTSKTGTNRTGNYVSKSERAASMHFVVNTSSGNLLVAIFLQPYIPCLSWTRHSNWWAIIIRLLGERSPKKVIKSKKFKTTVHLGYSYKYTSGKTSAYKQKQ